MGVGFASFEIPRSGMSANERGLYVTSHNISNANTPGYVRQQAIITSGPVVSEDGGKFQYGLGADIQQIRQIRNSFLDNIYRQESTTEGYWESKNKTFQDVQGVLGDPMNTGLQDVMNQFWDSWQELSKAPDSLTVRALVRQRGESLTQQINHMGEQIDKMQTDLNSEIGVRIDEVNQITSQVANLNLQIVKTEITGDTANDYRDQRNALVDRLTNLANVDVTEKHDGQLDITLGGYFLVSKGVSEKLYAAESQAGGLYYVPKLEGTNIEVPLKDGALKGLMESRGEVFGAKGSIQNGTPNTKADVVFAVDASNTSSAYLSNIQSNIASYVKQLKKSGVDYDLHLITYDDNVFSSKDYGTDDATLAADIPISATASTGNNFGGTNGVLDALGSTTFRKDANKFAVVFTGESIDGDGGTAVTDPSGYVNTLNSMGIKTSVVTDSNYFSSGDVPAECGWKSITDGTGGKLYDINTASAGFGAMMTTLASDTNDSVNQGISIVPSSNNTLPDIKKSMNALINIMAREVNSLHKSGKTMGDPSLDGQDFFVAIDDSLPLQMGNIKLNDNLMNLNNIVASTGGANGDNSIALNIANLRNNPIIKDTKGVLSIDDYYQSIILNVGNNGSDAQRIYGTSRAWCSHRITIENR